MFLLQRLTKKITDLMLAISFVIYVRL